MKAVGLGLMMLALVAATGGCASPTDIDTAREKRFLDSAGSKRMQTRSVTISFTGASAGVAYAVTLNGPIVVDTSRTTSAVWIDAVADAPAGTASDLTLRRLAVQIDSLEADGTERRMVEGTPPARMARFGTEFQVGYVQQHTANAAAEKLVIALGHDRAARRLDGTITIVTSIGGRLMQYDGTITITY